MIVAGKAVLLTSEEHPGGRCVHVLDSNDHRFSAGEERLTTLVASGHFKAEFDKRILARCPISLYSAHVTYGGAKYIAAHGLSCVLGLVAFPYRRGHASPCPFACLCPRLDEFGELPGDSAPAVVEAELFVLVAVGDVAVQRGGGVLGAIRVILHGDDGGHE
jgi:hypothetical protein